MMEITAESELASVATEVLHQLKNAARKDSAAVLALHGDLGAGKTTFMQTLATQLGVSEAVTSPTFVIMKQYPLEGQDYDELVHIDAYRIEDVDEMRPLGFDTILSQKGNIVCIEWAEKIASLLPAHAIHMNIAITGESRTITFDE